MAIIEIRVPSPGESITHVELYKWLVADGAVVKKETEIAELESEKATLTLVADEAGKVSFKASEGDSLEVGAVAFTIDTSVKPGEEKQAVAPATEVVTATEAAPVTEGKEVKSRPDEHANVKITPLAKRVMEENDLSLEDVMNGLRRLKRSDVEAVLAASGVSSPSGLKKPASRESKTDRMSPLRRKLSERLVSVKNETAMLTTFNEVNMKPIMDLRKKHQDKFVEKHGIKLGMMSFFLKACSIALQEFPNVNSMMEGENMTTYGYADISVAVSTPKGLMVPVIRNVESMGLAEIEKAIMEVADKARKGKLSIPEMTGGTFTITNGGVFGSMMSTPIINPPQSAILGMHNILDRPVVIDGQIVVRPMMYVALSYDHRVIDGRESVGFLVRVKQLLENPTDMLFGKSNGEKELLEL
ncbi:MAG TPA: 2-oxoglutarate dehydrogenase complex dihydrolipoyllysine-residue succinyltransferase [Petrimonas sp.]|uniref:2-oxoglutarate dehydrogenase complex dihydrolipoyllysine-residue succinyltransferase n=1 Tax=Petrimonas sp. TaxID=2023866 RepID=UPI001758C558|nr:2-oxoglutarate dehydrogenase complex dihydrolipoyllysine-residue succinyltransferase [Petrimonas sp.]MEA4949209.1 2-oxoglutarate dehydrogenase complex dihydrolipoyllysine-residue succinyltransferase [Petrimonas sp.]MEA5062526.1 2-oxoglutarate dehydrogenase complex dihydrolipoyllysine-residue succinyltransferase [Petrimonas sp.]HHV85916.1 2-oxoglutarate dehydrogenase complex dihydrolipoyllysine-residue succinyltransferase [Petrimonas sp.]